MNDRRARGEALDKARLRQSEGEAAMRALTAEQSDRAGRVTKLCR